MAALKKPSKAKRKTNRRSISALERATGKLELILARDPKLALAPTSVSAVAYDVYGSADAVKKAGQEAEDFLEEGKVQEARHILKGLASETVNLRICQA